MRQLRQVGIDKDAAASGITDKFFPGEQVAGVDYKVPDGQEAMTTVHLQTAWDLLKRQQQHEEEDRRVRIHAAMASTTGATGTTGVTTTTAASDDKKKYDPLQWKNRVDTYNNKTINGTPRRFPVNQLLGADEVLIKTEKELVSKQYTPVGMGDILDKRQFTSTGDVNPSLKRQGGQKQHTLEIATSDNGVELQAASTPTFDPRSVMLVQDATTAIGWLWKLFEMGDEPVIDEYIEWFNILVRKNPDKLYNVKQLWEKASWTIALEMRDDRRSFASLTHEIMGDQKLMNDCMSSREPMTPQKRLKSHNWASSPDKRQKPTKGDSKGGKFTWKSSSSYQGQKGYNNYNNHNNYNNNNNNYRSSSNGGGGGRKDHNSWNGKSQSWNRSQSWNSWSKKRE